MPRAPSRPPTPCSARNGGVLSAPKSSVRTVAMRSASGAQQRLQRLHVLLLGRPALRVEERQLAAQQADAVGAGLQRGASPRPPCRRSPAVAATRPSVVAAGRCRSAWSAATWHADLVDPASSRRPAWRRRAGATRARGRRRCRPARRPGSPAPDRRLPSPAGRAATAPRSRRARWCRRRPARSPRCGRPRIATSPGPRSSATTMAPAGGSSRQSEREVGGAAPDGAQVGGAGRQHRVVQRVQSARACGSTARAIASAAGSPAWASRIAASTSVRSVAIIRFVSTISASAPWPSAASASTRPASSAAARLRPSMTRAISSAAVPVGRASTAARVHAGPIAAPGAAGVPRTRSMLMAPP